MSAPVIIGAVFLWRAAWFWELIHRLPIGWLIGIQLYRLLGASFLILWLQGRVPTELGIVTGVYDVLIGISAPLVALLLVNRRTQNTVTIARLWNVLGLLDFAYAVTLITLATPELIGAIKLQPDPSAIRAMPLAMIALFGVPLSILLHIFSLLKLRSISIN